MEMMKGALKNHSMLEELSMSENELAFKRFNSKYFAKLAAPVGHAYSVMVEELGIKNPDIAGFIGSLNSRLGCLEKISDPSEQFWVGSLRSLSSYLGNEMKGGRVSREAYKKVMTAACGYEDNWTNPDLVGLK